MASEAAQSNHPEGLSDSQEALALSLLESEVLLFGSFTLKSGLQSPIYIDLRRLQSYPSTMNKAADAIIEQIAVLSYDRLTGIPMAAIPLASVVANRLQVPQITLRPTVKDHGITGKIIDGVFNPGDVILVMDDLVTTAASKLESIEMLQGNGLFVRDIAVVIDRQQGGRQQLEDSGFALHSALQIGPMMNFLHRVEKLPDQQFDVVMNYIFPAGE